MLFACSKCEDSDKRLMNICEMIKNVWTSVVSLLVLVAPAGYVFYKRVGKEKQQHRIDEQL